MLQDKPSLYAAYRFFFTKSKSQPGVIKKWLIKKGISFKEIDDLESTLKIVFINKYYSYTHNKIEFFTYMWTAFNQEVLNYFQAKKLLKNSSEFLLEEQTVNKETGEPIQINIGYTPSDHTNIDGTYDVEKFFSGLTGQEADICRLKFFNGYSELEISRHFNRPLSEIKKDIASIQNKYSCFFHRGINN
jgi:DNA-directed RNA polymerase specialized sigma24 family protein